MPREDGVLPEIWSLGLRNPWRFSFDACTADLYIGDVGESTFEEIEFEPANTPGRNYGWKTLEGPQCFDTTADINPDRVTLITSFGVDNAGELYVLSQLAGLYRIDPE